MTQETSAMKMFFEFDTEKLAQGEGRKKLDELKEFEKMLVEEVQKSERLANEKWLKSLPDKYF